jgi:2-dehydropantoate 2-reductase
VTSVAVIGPGAIGGIVAAWLAQSPESRVTVCARSPLADIVVDTPDGPLAAATRVLVDPAKAHPCDWVLVATKTYDVGSTATWLARLVGPETRIAVLQNGVEHVERFAGLVPAERIVPAVVDIPASRTGPGRMRQHRHGSILVPEGAHGEAFVALFAGSPIAVATDPDIRSCAWRKLCINAAGAVGALTFSPPGARWSPGLESIIRALAEECATVGRAEGAVVPPEVVEAVVERAAKSSAAGGRNSMEADRLAGRPMELEARNGVIVRLGRRHGIPTPVNAMIVAMLEASASPWAEQQL